MKSFSAQKVAAISIYRTFTWTGYLHEVKPFANLHKWRIHLFFLAFIQEKIFPSIPRCPWETTRCSFTSPVILGFSFLPFVIVLFKNISKAIHHKGWQFRRLALACLYGSAQPWRDHLEAYGNNSLSMPIKSLASPLRLQQGCQLMSIVVVVYVTGTPAHEELNRDHRLRRCSPWLWCTSI